MSVQNLWKLDLQSEMLSLTVGTHATREQGMCAMEMAAWLAGQPHSDRPRCSSEMIASYVRHLNDNMPDNARQRLIPFLPRLVDTAATEAIEQARSEFLAWKAVRVFAPAALRAAKHQRYARQLENQCDLFKAAQVTKAVRDKLSNGRYAHEWSPATLAAHRAHEAARSAVWFADNRDAPFGGASGITPYDACPLAAAGAAFQAYRAGCDEIWTLALQALDEAIGSPN